MIATNTNDLWLSTMRDLHVPAKVWAPLWQQLEDLYSEPHRHYHRLSHIDAMANALALYAPDAPTSVRLAVVYHDAIYETRCSDNEEKSARLASLSLVTLGLPDSCRKLTGQLIRCTKTHEPLQGKFMQISALFLDLDLLILGSPTREYDRYARNIRREYDWVPEADYRKGRSAVLNSFLQRCRIYATEALHVRYEAKALQNLKRELEELQERSGYAREL
jgi:predicted metal-dependent HD superfamily phosphohydrolase